MKTYKNLPYILTVNDDKAPLITLYYGKEAVECSELRSSEILVDGCQRVINKHLKHKGFHNYLNICKAINAETDKAKVSADNEELWLDYLKTDLSIKLRELLQIIREDLGI